MTTPQEAAVLQAALKLAQTSKAVMEFAAVNPSPRYREIKIKHGELVGKRSRALCELQNAADELLKAVAS